MAKSSTPDAGAANSPPVVGNPSFAVESYNLTNSAVGFFLAGFGIYAGDPGPGILLAGPGGVLLLLGVLLVARDVARKVD